MDEVKIAEKTYNKICERCQQPFLTFKEKRRFCSDECKKKPKEKKERKCLRCGTPYAWTGKGQKFCGKECRVLTDKENRHNKRVANRRKARKAREKTVERKPNVLRESPNEKFNEIHKKLWEVGELINELESAWV
jgi:endogenous inhibitor of DNA gyrase (YacG/DUF329 family)